MARDKSAKHRSERTEEKAAKHEKREKKEKKQKADASDDDITAHEIAKGQSSGTLEPISSSTGVKKEKKSKKRKLDEVVEESTKSAEVNETSSTGKESSKRKKQKKNEKTDSATETQKEDILAPVAAEPGSSERKERKNAGKRTESERAGKTSSKTRKGGKAENDEESAKVEEKQQGDSKSGAQLDDEAQKEDVDVADEETRAEANGDYGGRKTRFIAFIGQLPYSATVESVSKHFEKISPTSIRLPTHKSDPTKNKGFAFLEFEAYDRMKTCLKLYHRTTFDDGISPPRKIKVELTAGGGGSTDQRKEKIKYKNEKLSDERRRRAHAESVESLKQETKQKFADAKGRHSRKQTRPRKGPRVDQQLQENASTRAGPAAAGDHVGMHPDRLARIG